MGNIKILIGRNVSLFERNKTNVILCGSSILVVLALYTMFLRNSFVETVLRAGMDTDLVEEFVDRFMIPGLFIVINTTTCFGIMQMLVNDKAQGIRRDFIVSPVKQFELVFGYWIAGICSSFFFTCMTAIGAEFYFYIRYDSVLGLIPYIQVLLTIFISSIVNVGIILFITRFIKDTTTFSTFGNLYGTVTGFLAGAYLPFSIYPDWLKGILFYYPPTQLTSILRQFYLKNMEGTKEQTKLLTSLGVYLEANGRTYRMIEQWWFIGIFLICLIALEIGRTRLEHRC